MIDYKDLTIEQMGILSHFNSICDDYSIPVEEGMLYDFFAFDDKIVSAIGICPLDGEIELYGITMPDYRNRGYFTKLLKRCELKSFKLPIIYTLSETSESKGNVYSEEYLLSYSKHTGNPASLAEQFSFKKTKSMFTLYKSNKGKRISLGHLRFSAQENRTFIYNVYIRKGFRRKGFGEILLNSFLSSCEEDTFLLHVSGDNIVALALYKKLDFTIESKVTYFLL